MNEQDTSKDYEYKYTRENIPEYNSDSHLEAEPWQIFREETSSPQKYKPFTFTEQERRVFAAGPNIEVEVPDDFELTEENLKDVLEKISDSDTLSVMELMEQGVNASGIDRIPSVVNVDEINGTSDSQGWSGLVEGMGERSSSRTPPVSEIKKYADHFLSMGEYQRRRFVSDISIAVHEENDSKDYFVYSDGRHRVMTFKALSALGFEIKFTNMPVTVLKKPVIE